MPVEIERKFLVANDAWRGRPGQRYCQGYLASDAGVTVRVRRAGAQAYITIKGQGEGGLVRPEYEYEIPVEEAELGYLPTTSVELDADNARKMLKLRDLLDENEDVQEVYSNEVLPEGVTA